MPSADVYAALGDTAAAAPILGALAALDAAGIVAVVGTGGGRTTGVVLAVDTPVPGAHAAARRVAEDGVAASSPRCPAAGQLTPSGETIPMGVPPESTLFARSADEMVQLLGGRCADCGTINTPPSIHPTCIACGGSKLEPVALARHGVVHTFVVNQTMPAPFVAPLPIAVVDLDDGARGCCRWSATAPASRSARRSTSCCAATPTSAASPLRLQVESAQSSARPG